MAQPPFERVGKPRGVETERASECAKSGFGTVQQFASGGSESLLMPEPVNASEEEADGGHLLFPDVIKARPRIFAELPALGGAEVEEFGLRFAGHVG
jgi:hypothetical protein